MNGLPANLPSVAHAELPAVYEAAREALAECQRVDECKDWADRTKALASYAKQADDQTLEKHAVRIRARAIRRCGELLREHDAKGKRTDLEPVDGAVNKSKRDAAREAGMSQRQQDTAVRVANVPAAEFEEQVESDNPPSVTQLAEQGKKPRPLVDLEGRDPSEYRLATQAQGHLRHLSEFVATADPAAVSRGTKDHERAAMVRQARDIVWWISELETELGRS